MGRAEPGRDLCRSARGEGRVLIADFHAHVYFDATELETARAFVAEAEDRFTLLVGRFHEKPVGPHPRGSCQLTLGADEFGRFASWAPMARGPLTIFAHANTGDHLADHTRHAVWFGPSETLDLSVFR